MVQYELIKGEPIKAANALENLGIDLSYSDIMLTEFYMFAQRGVLSESVLADFIEALPVEFGAKIDGVTSDNLACGLYLEDVITYIGSNRLCSIYQLPALIDSCNNATLTIVRDDVVYTMPLTEDISFRYTHYIG